MIEQSFLSYEDETFNTEYLGFLIISTSANIQIVCPLNVSNRDLHFSQRASSETAGFCCPTPAHPVGWRVGGLAGSP